VRDISIRHSVVSHTHDFHSLILLSLLKKLLAGSNFSQEIQCFIVQETGMIEVLVDSGYGFSQSESDDVSDVLLSIISKASPLLAPPWRNTLKSLFEAKRICSRHFVFLTGLRVAPDSPLGLVRRQAFLMLSSSSQWSASSSTAHLMVVFPSALASLKGSIHRYRNGREEFLLQWGC